MEHSGEVVFDNKFKPFTNGKLHVYVEDQTEVDAPAIKVGIYIFMGLRRDKPDPVPFRVPTNRLPPNRQYGMRAWIDVDSDDELGKGDYTSTQSHPTPSSIDHEIPLTRV